MPLFHILTAFLILTFAVPSYAQDINGKDAQKLQYIFENILKKQQDKITKGGSTLNTMGEITVEQADSYYAVTLPAITISDEQANKTELGMIAINVKPTDSEKSWTMSVALPMPIVKKDKDGAIVNELNIGQQKMTGLWHEDLQIFSKVDANYNNIAFNDFRKNTSINVESIVIESDVTINDDKVSGPTDIILKGISSSGKKAKDVLTIDSIAFNAQYDDINIAMINSTSLIPLAKNIGGMSLKATMNNLKGVYALDKLNFLYNSPKPKGNKASQLLRFSYDGLTATKENMIYADLMPQKSEIDLELKDLPLDSLLNILRTQVEKSDKPSAAQQLIMMQMITNLPSQLAKTGTVFDIKNLDFKNKTYDFDTEGQIKASKDSPFGMIGNIILNMKGLDETQALIDNKIEDASTTDKAILTRLKNQLTSLKSIMKKKIGGYESEIELTKDGTVTINGEDMGNPITAVSNM